MRTLQRISAGLVVLMAALFTISPPSPAFADDCAAIGGVLFAGPPAECRITGAVTVAPGAYTIDNTLHFLSGGALTVSPQTSPFMVSVTGNLLMDAGSLLKADAASGPGGTIVITTTGNITLKGGNPGAIISSNTPPSCPPSKPKAGIIELIATGNVITEDGSRIETVGGCGKGEITISGKIVDIDGVVLSEGNTSKGAGGPITVTALCTLNVSPTGEIVSIGRDPGADLVLLSGGCQVTVFGLVASTGAAHTPDSGLPYPTKCDDGLHTLGTFNPRACVRILAGNNTAGGGPAIIIDSRSPNNGEVHADTGFSGGTTGFGWIDIFATGDIEIDGDTVAPFAVHANQGLTSGHGGLINVKSTARGVSALGLAIQASDRTSGGAGGVIVVEAKQDVNLNNSSGVIEAAGSVLGGTRRSGGQVFVRSFGTAPNTGSILVTAPFTIDVTGKSTTLPNGVVDLKACGTVGFPPLTVLPAGVTPTVATGVCGGAPVLPAGVILPNCGQCGSCACINTFSPLSAAGGATLTLNGTNLSAVESVIFGANCDPGSAAANGTVVTPFSSQTNDVITLPVPAGLAAGSYKVIITAPGQLPGSTGSCCAPGSFTKP
jgi:hypothetical protein